MMKTQHKANKFIQIEKKLSDQGGFTLVEIAIVLIIGGFLMSLMGTVLFSYLKKHKITQTEFRLEEVNKAMERYLSVNGRYPCPANRRLGPENTAFGREVHNRCNSGAHTGTTLVGGARIGAVPVRTLSLPDQYALDGWGQKFTFAVTATLATQTNAADPTTVLYTHDGGSIEVDDSAGNSMVTPADTAHYVIVSHGSTGQGSYPASASVNPSGACPPLTGANRTLDSQNCDVANNVFTYTLVNSDTDSVDFYDDRMIYKGQTVPRLAFPEDAVLAFNRSDCPPGWSEYVQARGRFVIGSGTATIRKYDVNPTSPPDVTSITITNTSGPSGGDPEANLPPYVPLFYCVKD